MFAHSSIVLSAYSYTGSQGAGACPSIDCTEGGKIPLTRCQFTDGLTIDRHSLALTFTSMGNL